MCVIGYSKHPKHFEYEASCQLPVLLLAIYTLILNICFLVINIIISVKGMQEISDKNA